MDAVPSTGVDAQPPPSSPLMEVGKGRSPVTGDGGSSSPGLSTPGSGSPRLQRAGMLLGGSSRLLVHRTASGAARDTTFAENPAKL